MLCGLRNGKRVTMASCLWRVTVPECRLVRVEIVVLGTGPTHARGRVARRPAAETHRPRLPLSARAALPPPACVVPPRYDTYDDTVYYRYLFKHLFCLIKNWLIIKKSSFHCTCVATILFIILVWANFVQLNGLFQVY